MRMTKLIKNSSVKFNIFDFGSTFTRLFESSVPVTPDNIEVCKGKKKKRIKIYIF